MEEEIAKKQEIDWGQFYASNRKTEPDSKSLRVLLFGSTLGGMRSLETLATLNRHTGGAVHLVGMVTDDATDDSARISKQRRIWRYYKKDEQATMRNRIVEQALDLGVDVFTGSVKASFFKKKLAEWDPHLILVSCFGQIVKEDVFAYPKLGIYNIHPSDIEKGIGLGPRPFEDSLNSGLGRTRVTMHRLEEEVDGGSIVGQTGLININWGAGIVPQRRVLILDQKMTAEFPFMVAELIHTACWRLWNGLEGTVGQLDFEAEKHSKRQLTRPERYLRVLVPDPLLSVETQKDLAERSKRIKELYDKA